ncbi:DUF1579 family protein [Nocardia cyriacigeorgica]|uniref:DUF1579 family protein n=1 Tax=Nocardia cyriacigeorgica TaxID=135487 RepID=UPI0014018E6A|nr:DUF1579 family protein [Nocardia cyriacigeorgica]NEW26908.1 DUF1579 domain-containing protein [Nocardia cyriacigeorgica]
MISNKFRRLFTATLVAVAVLGTACGSPDAGQASSAPATSVVATNMPEHQDAGHARLNVLAGEWRADKYTYVAGGTPDAPLRGDLVSRWHWIAETGGNFLQEEVSGILSGKPYFRMGLLGYSPLDDRYEWTTVDSITPMTMAYRSDKGSAGGEVITMSGEFTDPGVLGAENTGKPTAMRTELRIESSDRVVMEIFFAPTGLPERLADRVILTRRA